ncbi:hypothetical protein LJR118_003911 [Acidovorax sp. LjRoot118]|uniref:hypothetical protein n=1 Tax=unclassified Acidovorax TaxID=2684926 RepID=UPI000A4CAAC9|nr:hypothetical protein [Acidovorax sp. Root219]
MATTNLIADVGPALVAHVSSADTLFRDRVLRVRAESMAHGVLHGSRTTMAVFEAGKSVFDMHAKVLYEDVLQLSVSYLGDEAGSRIQEIQELYSAVADAIAKQLFGIATSSVPAIQDGFQTQFESSFNDRVKVVTESYVARLRMDVPGKLRALMPAPQAVFHGPVATAVVGNSNTVHSSQHVGMSGDSLAALLKAISELRSVVESDTTIAEQERAARLRSLEVLENEAEQPSPSKYALGGLLNGVSAWTQGMAAAPGAVSAINEFLARLG